MYQILSLGVRETGPQEKRKFLRGEGLKNVKPLQVGGFWPAGILLPRF